ncbi:MAG: hypothetical protein LAT75_13415 [Candidatus Cyclonatronum sp.]|uniref:hypothetical protein n=1 Tax=Cyclonatronum sp. TaxID=3024185 RepID=UPI0025C59528|nr:hypothetical protein [Cyclonatronum sp.]MCC5935431.1 hypothetical protein [Balneolales bacterium]MCH8487862.1 hypothetical protein [Cyclonatronum sp.]
MYATGCVFEAAMQGIQKPPKHGISRRLGGFRVGTTDSDVHGVFPKNKEAELPKQQESG